MFATVCGLFAWMFASNVAMAVVPHEPAVIWYGARLGVWPTTAVATAGTAVASIMDHRVFGSWLLRRAHRPLLAGGTFGWIRRRFVRAPFLVIALSGLTPLPAFPFKVAALTEGYPRLRYVAAMATGRIPRYLLLAWAGLTLAVPTWGLVLLTLLMVLPTLIQGMQRWIPRNVK